MTALSILYRGPLASCNYACGYCPFAKREDDETAIAEDRRALERFVGWARRWQKHRLAVFFTPWGEALVRRYYRDAIAELSHLAHVERVAIQTNLSAPLAFLTACDVSKVALWCTYHPGEVARARFASRCKEARDHGARLSVGVVGLREHFDEIEALRAELPAGTYLWVNAASPLSPAYTNEEAERLSAVDPLFRHNLAPPASLGAPCRAGETVIAVDGDGNVRRCHFVPRVIANLYEEGWEAALRPRRCPRAACTCHIGYVHRKDLGLYDVFGDGVLERVPRAIGDEREHVMALRAAARK
jgi:hypothetical protein